MHEYRVHSLSPDIAAHVRTLGTSPQYGHPAHREVATGTGPCRVCLHPFDVGVEERLLFTLDPFDGLGARPLPGPMFVHVDECVAHDGVDLPAQLRAIPLVAEAYRAEGEFSGEAEVVSDAEGEVFDALFSDTRVQFVHLRHAEAGCYVARVERGAVSEEPRALAAKR